MANKCKDCGCTCKRCVTIDQDVELHVEIESLKQKLVEKENHIVTMETNFLNEANKFPNGEVATLREELSTWQDKYKRLYEAHRRVQRVNQGLEDKLLKLVDICETEKNALTKDVATLSKKLADANYAVKKLTDDNKRYKSDVSLAIQFLQCKQSNFVAHKFDSLPPEVQSQVANYMTTKKKPEERKPLLEPKSIKVPIPTFPPTAMVYSVPKSPNPERKSLENSTENVPVDIVSAAIMAKVLEERQRERSLVKHCDTCTCSKHLSIIHNNTHYSIGVQTENRGCFQDSSSLNTNRGTEQHRINHPSIHGLDNLDPSSSTLIQSTNHNIVKVQPNNFLTNHTSKSNSNTSSPLNKHATSSKSDPTNPNNHVISNEINIYQDNLFGKKAKIGSKNILLDNALNVAPILYTETSSVKSDGSAQNRLRVAEWIRNSMKENGENCESKNEAIIDREKYAEMEDNVRRFLFGESEFLKTVELGKKKYERYREGKVNVAETDI